jgi:type IV pilus assembly protein PilC
MSACAQFCRTLGTLAQSGVPILSALQIVRNASPNRVISGAVQKLHDAVKEGESMSGTMGKTGAFPAVLTGMVQVGEETGALPEMLTRVAGTYEEEVDNAVEALTSLIEPAMIVVLAVLVGTIVIALFLPLIDLIKLL